MHDTIITTRAPARDQAIRTISRAFQVDQAREQGHDDRLRNLCTLHVGEHGVKMATISCPKSPLEN